MKSCCASGATPALSNVWCTLLAKKQQKRGHHHHHVPISLEDYSTIIWRQPETKCLESVAHYLQLMSMAGRSVQRARRPRPQKPQRRQPPDVALEWAASVRASSNVALPPSPAAVTSLNISVLIVSLRFDPHAPRDPQLAAALALTPPDAACPATRADSQRKFHTLTHCWPCALRGQLLRYSFIIFHSKRKLKRGGER